MSYLELRYYMYLYHIGYITKMELGMAIHIWQRVNN